MRVGILFSIRPSTKVSAVGRPNAWKFYVRTIYCMYAEDVKEPRSP